MVGTLRAARIWHINIRTMAALEPPWCCGTTQDRGSHFEGSTRNAHGQHRLTDIYVINTHRSRPRTSSGRTRASRRPNLAAEVSCHRIRAIDHNTHHLRNICKLRHEQLVLLIFNLISRLYFRPCWNHDIFRRAHHVGIRDRLLHIHRSNSRTRPCNTAQQQPRKNHTDQKRSLSPDSDA